MVPIWFVNAQGQKVINRRRAAIRPSPAVQRVLDDLAAVRNAARQSQIVIWPQVPMARDRGAA